MATVVEVLTGALEAYLSRPENADAVRQIESYYSRVWEQIQEPLAAIAEQIREVADSPPSIGYEPFFISEGYHRFSARILARIIVCGGRRVAIEEQRRTSVLQAISFLAQPSRKSSAILIRAKTLTAAWREASLIETIFDEHRLPNLFEFVELLDRAANGFAFDRDRLTQIAASVAAVAKSRRGPKVAASSAAHEVLIREFARPGGPKAFTWCPYEGDYIDAATRATRLEFDNTAFSPKAASLRARKRWQPQAKQSLRATEAA